jgi:AraC-like DNA-binding protein
LLQPPAVPHVPDSREDPLHHGERVAQLALHQPDARSAARLRSALGSAHDLTVCESWHELERALASSGVEGCLLDADHPTPSDAADRIRILRSRHRYLALVGFTDRGNALAYYRLGATGLDGFVSMEDGAITTRAAIDDALAHARGRKVRAWLDGVLPDPGPALLGWAVAHAGPETDVDRLAEAVRQSPRTLRHTLRVEDLGTPSSILLWGRLLLTAWRLSRDGRGIEETAFTLGYSAANSLRRALRTHAGLTVRRVSKRDGVECLLDALAARIGEAARTLPNDLEVSR